MLKNVRFFLFTIIAVILSTSIYAQEAKLQNQMILDSSAIHILAVNPVNPEQVYAVSDLGVYRSDDQGNAWSKLSSYSAAALALTPLYPNYVYAGMYMPSAPGFYVSENKGDTWIAEYLTYEEPPYAIAVNSVYPNIIYTAFRTSGAMGSVWRSNDGGRNWSRTNLSIQDVHVLEVNPVNSNIIYAAAYYYDAYSLTYDFFQSFDEGNTWVTRTDLHDIQVTDIVVNPMEGNMIYVGSYHNGIYQSLNNGLTWTHLALKHERVNEIAIHPTDPNILYAATDGGNVNYYPLYESKNAGQTWSPSSLRTQGVESIAIDPVNPNIIYAGTTNEGIYRSFDGGETWVAPTSGT